MAEIIDFSKAKREESDTFAIEDDNGDLKPIELWTGDDWKTLIEVAMVQIGDATGQTKWDAFAGFMHALFNEFG